MGKLTLALLSGGVSSEREVSLNSGDQVFEALDKDKYQIIRYDPKTDLARLVADAPGIDAALIILHGPYGEDGTVQGLLELLGIPYQGSGVLGSALAMNKLAAKYLYEKAGLPVPPYIALQKGDPLDPAAWEKQLGLPLVATSAAMMIALGLPASWLGQPGRSGASMLRNLLPLALATILGKTSQADPGLRRRGVQGSAPVIGFGRRLGLAASLQRLAQQDPGPGEIG